MNPEDYSWIVLFLPLAAAAIITLFTQRHGKLSAQISIAAVAVSFLMSLFLLLVMFILPSVQADAQTGGEVKYWNSIAANWLSIGDLKIEIGLYLDPLSVLMLLIVTGVGGAIHVYSWGYMKEDRCVSRFFASLSLFTFSMLGIVLAKDRKSTRLNASHG